MDKLIERAVERSIGYMRDNVGEQITIDDIARAAMFSKFYFTRFFQRVTGMSPGRFLSAIRLQRAKELLLTTELTVTEISYRVGYNSIGTFSSRFNDSVGLSPTAYRHQRGRIEHLPGETGTGMPDDRTATVRGRLRSAYPDHAGVALVGLFISRLPQGRPVRWVLQAEPGPFVLDNVPPGHWYLFADLLGENQIAVSGPVNVRPGFEVELRDLWLRPISVFDPPVLFAGLAERVVAARTAAARERRLAA